MTETTIIMDLKIQHDGDTPPTQELAAAVANWAEGENVYVGDDPRTFVISGGDLSGHDPSHPHYAGEPEPEALAESNRPEVEDGVTAETPDPTATDDRSPAEDDELTDN